jgi:hypothetical protein
MQSFGEIAFGHFAAGFLMGEAKVHLEKFYEREKRLPLGVIDEVIEGKNVAGGAEIGAGVNDFRRGGDGLQNLNDNAIGGEKFDGTLEEGRIIGIDESFCRTNESLEVKEHGGIDNDAAGGILAGMKNILRAAAEEELVCKNLQAMIEDGLASDETFVHGVPPKRETEMLS